MDIDIDKIPVLGKMNKTVNVFVVNFVLLGLVCLILAIVIPFFPKVLDVLIAALLLVSAIILFNIAYNIYSYKKKYMKWFK